MSPGHKLPPDLENEPAFPLGAAGELLHRVKGFLEAEGVSGYLVGGFVRDRLLGRPTQDIDIAVTASAPAVARRLADALKGKFVLLDDENGVARIVLPIEGWHLDLATIAEGLDQDLARRDFTVDAMAVPLGGQQVLDPLGGRADLSRRLLRATGQGVFRADPLRLLRAVRLCAELGFQIEPETAQLIRSHAPLLSGVAGERMREELMRLFSVPHSCPALQTLDSLELLAVLFPELEAARGVTQPPEHHWDVFQHSMQCVAAAEFLLGEGEWPASGASPDHPALAELRAHFQETVAGFPRRALLKLACLLHDVAKPQSKGPDQRGRMRFLGHAHSGAQVAQDILRRLRFSQREVAMVATMVAQHLRPTQMTNQERPTQRAVYRFLRDTGEVGYEVLFLSLADHLAARGPNLIPEAWAYHLAIADFILQEQHRQRAEVKPLRLLSGYDIMEQFGLQPGPRLGQLLEMVQEAHAAGEISTREAALSLVRKELAK